MVPSDKPMFIYLLPNKSMLLDTGQIFNTSLGLFRGASASLNILKKPRGILIKVNDT